MFKWATTHIQNVSTDVFTQDNPIFTNALGFKLFTAHYEKGKGLMLEGSCEPPNPTWEEDLAEAVAKHYNSTITIKHVFIYKNGYFGGQVSSYDSEGDLVSCHNLNEYFERE